MQTNIPSGSARAGGNDFFLICLAEIANNCYQICERQKFFVSLHPMIVTFEETYLKDLYTVGRASDKKHRFQPQIISKYVRVVNLMKQQENVLGLTKYGSLHYEKLHGDKEGLSSVRVNDQYRIEFKEVMEAGKQIATICNITDLSNHYNK